MRKYFSTFLHGLIFLIIVDLIGTALWAWGVTHSFDGNVVPKVSMAAVLIHDFDEQTGELGRETLRRLDHVLELYQEGAVESILCVGGARPRNNVFGSESMRGVLVKEGVLEEEIFVEKESFDTRTNWAAIYENVQGYGWNAVVVVSSPFHLYRFRQIMKEHPKEDLTVFLSPYSVKYAYPSISLAGIWGQTHYEWAAHFSRLIPREFFEKWIRRFRRQYEAGKESLEQP